MKENLSARIYLLLNSHNWGPAKAIVDYMEDLLQFKSLNLDGGKQCTHNSFLSIVGEILGFSTI